MIRENDQSATDFTSLNHKRCLCNDVIKVSESHCLQWNNPCSQSLPNSHKTWTEPALETC